MCVDSFPRIFCIFSILEFCVLLYHYACVSVVALDGFFLIFINGSA